MVYQGPSRGCQTCRTRRIKCDEGTPACNNCLKRKRACPGYKDSFDIRHKNETDLVPEKIRKRKAAQERKEAREDIERTLVPYHELKPDIEMESLCFFFTSYVTVPRDPQTNFFMQHLLPLYSRVQYNSPLASAISAVAINISSMWRLQGPNAPLAQKQYSRAMTLTQAAINDPKQNKTDELLAAVLLLDFYETVTGRSRNRAGIATHQDGATALVKHRGSINYTDDISRRLLSMVRNQMVSSALQKKEEVACDPQIWSDAESTASDPSGTLDQLSTRFAKLQAQLCALSPETPVSTWSSSSRDSRPSPGSPESEIENILRQALSLEARFSKWPDSVPGAWVPTRLGLDLIPPSVQAAGLYGSHCEVYPVIPVGTICNNYRIRYIQVLQFIEKCKRILDTESIVALSIPEDFTAIRIQSLVDDVCATVPFHLGNRTAVSLPNDTSLEYPPLPCDRKDDGMGDLPASCVDALGNPTKMTMAEHIQSAASIGGYSLLRTLGELLQLARPDEDSLLTGGNPLPIRAGQMQWIFGQLKRIRNIYMIPASFLA